MERFRAVAIVIVLVLASQGSAANWQYTTWGMDPAEVVRASGGHAVATAPQEKADGKLDRSGEVPLLKAPWVSGRFTFTAEFYFGSRGDSLSRVVLSLEDPKKGLELIGALRSKYGKPDSHSESAVFELIVWRGPEDQVSLTRITDKSVNLSYQPRISKDNEGL